VNITIPKMISIGVPLIQKYFWLRQMEF